MSMEIFTVYDSAAKRFLEPFFAETIEVAMRMFRQLANKEGHAFSRFPEDYSLFHIGAWEPEQGILLKLDTPHSLGVAITYVQRPRLEA